MFIYFLVDWCRFSLSACVEIELRARYEWSKQLGHWARNLCLLLTASLPFLQYIANREVWSLIFLMKTTSAVARTSSRGTTMKMQSNGTDLGWQIGPSRRAVSVPGLLLTWLFPALTNHQFFSNLGPHVFFLQGLSCFPLWNTGNNFTWEIFARGETALQLCAYYLCIPTRLPTPSRHAYFFFPSPLLLFGLFQTCYPKFSTTCSSLQLAFTESSPVQRTLQASSPYRQAGARFGSFHISQSSTFAPPKCPRATLQVM